MLCRCSLTAWPSGLMMILSSTLSCVSAAANLFGSSQFESDTALASAFVPVVGGSLRQLISNLALDSTTVRTVG